VCKNLKAKIKFYHVDSHQDENLAVEDLSLPAQLNTMIADSLANKEYDYSPPPWSKVMPRLEASVITFRNNNHRLTSSIDNELIRLRRDFSDEKAALKSWNIKRRYAKKVDWEALDKNMNKWNKFNYGGAVKCLHRWWDTMKRKKRWNQVQSGICTLCEEKIESCDHVL